MDAWTEQQPPRCDGLPQETCVPLTWWQRHWVYMREMWTNGGVPLLPVASVASAAAASVPSVLPSVPSVKSDFLKHGVILFTQS